MSRDSGVVTIEELLRHQEWVDGLARSMARDSHRADDVSQETWVAALRNGTGNGTGNGPRSAAARAWLGSVVRNFVRLGHRADRRRSRREFASARNEATVDDSLERFEVREALMSAVDSLPSPYREVIVLRYFEDLSTSEISRVLEMPYEGVKTRLRRARDLLRDRLDRRFDSGSWLAALVPSLDPTTTAVHAVSTATTASATTSAAATTALSTLGGLVMSTKIAIAVTVIAVGFAGYSWSLGTKLDDARTRALTDRNEFAATLDAANRRIAELEERATAAVLERQEMAKKVAAAKPVPAAMPTDEPTTAPSVGIANDRPPISLSDIDRRAREAAARSDLQALWLMAADLLQLGEPGYDKIIELAALVNPGTVKLWRDEEVVAGAFFRTMSEHLDEVLDFGLYLDEQQGKLPKFLDDFQDELIHEGGVILLGYYEGENYELLDRYVEKYRRGLDVEDIDRNHRSEDMIRALGQIPTEASFELLVELLDRTDGRMQDIVAKTLAWQRHPDALATLEKLRATRSSERNLESLDAAIAYLRGQ